MRNALISKLSDGWRNAEDYYLETEDDSKKWKMKERQDKANLTDEEREELEDMNTARGI